MKIYRIKVNQCEFLTASIKTAKEAINISKAARLKNSGNYPIELYEYDVKTQGKNFHTLALSKKI